MLESQKFHSNIVASLESAIIVTGEAILTIFGVNQSLTERRDKTFKVL